MSDCRMEEVLDYMSVYVERGPFKTAYEFYSRFIRRDGGLSIFLLGQKQLLTLFINCIIDFFRRDGESSSSRIRALACRTALSHRKESYLASLTGMVLLPGPVLWAIDDIPPG